MSDPLKLLVLLAAASTAAAQPAPVQDPMRPLVVGTGQSARQAPEERLLLTAVLISASRRIAVINGDFYRVGDRIDGDEVVAIERGHIRIRRDDELVLIALRDQRHVNE